MSDTIITVEGLGKKYRLGQKSNERYKALRDVLTEKVGGMFGRECNQQRPKIDNEIWRLAGISDVS